jgi:hypothetical protein
VVRRELVAHGQDHQAIDRAGAQQDREQDDPGDRAEELGADACAPDAKPPGFWCLAGLGIARLGAL